MWLGSGRRGQLEGGRRPARVTREGSREEEQTRTEFNDTQSTGNATLGVPTSKVVFFKKGPKPPLCQVKEAKSPSATLRHSMTRWGR